MICHLWPYTFWLQGVCMNFWLIFRSLDLSHSPCTGLGTGNLLLYKHHIVYSPDSEPHLGSAWHNSETEGQRWHWTCSCSSLLTALLAKLILLLSSQLQPFVLMHKHLLCPMVTWLREVWKDRWAAEVKRKWLPAIFSVSTCVCWGKFSRPAAWETFVPSMAWWMFQALS